MHKIIWLALIAGITFACPAVLGQTQTVANGVHIYTEPAGLPFSIDGQAFVSQADLLWPMGSKHVIASWDRPLGGTYFGLDKISTNLSPENIAGMPITADPALKWVKVVFKTSYLLTISLPDCGAPASHAPGIVEVNEKPYVCLTEMWLDAGSRVHARAFPNGGYVFTGWGFVWQLDHPTQYDITFQMMGPLTLAAFFLPANALTVTANVITDPPQLKVFLDRTPYVAPMSLEWGWGTTHALGTDPVQVANGVTYIFDSWSDAGPINHDIQVPSQAGAINLTARFVGATKVNFTTSPPGLTLNIDGRQNWPNYSFAWLPGSVHNVTAPATQTDAHGHKYRFASWSNGKPASFDYTAGPAPGDDNITAVYQLLGQATLMSDPPGLTLQVDGANCITPCAIDRDEGAAASISAQPTLKATEQSRLTFRSWTDGGNASHTIVLTPDLKKYLVSYTLQNRLTLSASPADGAIFLVNPLSPDAFYNAGDLVSVGVKAALGFRVDRWSGDLSGSNMSVTFAMDAPKSATLMLDPVPVIAPLGVQNAATGAIPASVAPGSLISIFGANLAPEFLIGPANPLAQTLGSVTVRVDDIFLPLVYVSPQQINAQLPAATSEGNHNIIVRWEGKPETATSITVTRNAPGLFNTGPQSHPAGTFVRPDGSTVTPDSPVHPGEVISILGTGLGPYTIAPPDGFLLDERAGYRLADPAAVVLGDITSVDPLYAGRCGLGVGVDCVRFQVPAGLADSSTLAVRVRVNGNESNTVFLPVAGSAVLP